MQNSKVAITEGSMLKISSAVADAWGLDSAVYQSSSRQLAISGASLP